MSGVKGSRYMRIIEHSGKKWLIRYMHGNKDRKEHLVGKQNQIHSTTALTEMKNTGKDFS